MPERLANRSPICEPVNYPWEKLGGKELPVPLRDHFDGAAGHFYGGLVINRIRRRWYARGHFFQVVTSVNRSFMLP
jgi:hypothetical protein